MLFRSTLLDVMAHLCEMYRRAVPPDPPLASTFSLDESVRISAMDGDAARAWLAVAPTRTPIDTDGGDRVIDEIDGDGDDDNILPPVPDDDARAVSLTATRWEDVVQAAGERPLLRLRLTAYLPARAQAVTVALQPLGAESTTVSTQVKGTSRSGGSLDLTVQEVKMSAPFNPLTVARTLFADLAHGGTYRASVTAAFGDTGRFGIDDQLADIAVRFNAVDVPEERIDVSATFAPVPEESR